MLGPVDIVWAIDTSASMVDEVAAVQANITAFADMISSAGIDHHVVMLASVDVAGPTPLGTDAMHYLYALSAVGSNNALLSVHLDPRTGRALIITAIDNLVKGAAGQAVQCANLMFGLDEDAGLPTTGWMP